MPSWFHSLQFRLVLGFALVLTLALSGVSLYVKYAAAQEVDRFQREVEEARAARVRQVVSQHYSKNKGWQGLGPVLEQAGSLYGWQIVVRDPMGMVVGESRRGSGRPWRKAMRRNFPVPMATIANQGRTVGEVSILPSDEPVIAPEPPVSQLLSALDRSLLLTGIAAGVGGILLVSLISGRVLSSVRTLSTAARRFGRGDLSYRVPSLTRDEIGELGRTFNYMASSLEKAERQRRNLVVDVAHELRTPLSNIQGYLEAMSDGLLQPDKETIETIRQQVLHLGHLVEDLRVLALAESGDLRLNCGPDSLARAIESSINAIRPRAEARQISLTQDTPDGFPMVHMDKTRIQQVLGNLLENAVRHTPTGGKVTVHAEVVDGRTARVTVADNGHGIPPADLLNVFERFYRVDPSRSRATGGAGLGLTIAKQLIEAHGGSIHAESTPDVGSKFIFELPLADKYSGQTWTQ